MSTWLLELRDNLGEDVVLHIVGTKADVVAERPEKRQVPFERCIKYAAEHLHNNATTAQDSSGAVSTRSNKTSHPGTGAGAGAGTGTATPTPIPTPQHSLDSSKRSSGFWGQDSGWDCCHEISAKDGEGVDEVFRVIARKLMDQRRRHFELEYGRMPGVDSLFGMTTGASAVGSGGGGYFEQRMDGRGSFRVGVGDKRRSWLGFPASLEGVSQGQHAHALAALHTKGRCC